MTGCSGRRVMVTEDPDYEPEEPYMQFRLTYEGPLRSSQNDPRDGQKDPRATHKHQIRRVFHQQLKRLWEITPFLATGKPPVDVITVNASPQEPYSIEALARRHARGSFNFVPLVTENLDLICGLDILFLRPDKPGKLWTGDIDNRMKTLLDALRIPRDTEEYALQTPAADEQPFFCLLEDDSLITKLSVETDQLLEFLPDTNKLNDTRIVVTVNLRPFQMHVDNMAFG